MDKGFVPPEFRHLVNESGVPWERLAEETEKRVASGKSEFEAFTDAAIDIASRECMGERPDVAVLRLGMEAALNRGRLAEALFISTDTDEVAVQSLRGIALFVLSDVDGLRKVLRAIEQKVDDDSPPADRVRLSTVKIYLGALERDTSTIICVMEFDSLLEEYPEQVEQPLIETMFTLYVIGSLLREIGEAARATRIADTLEDMARSRGHRMMLGLVENLRGNTCNLQGKFDEAEEHYLRFQCISEELSFELGAGIALNNLGTLKLNSLKLEEALRLFEQAYSVMNMARAKVNALANIGEINTLLGRYEDAERALREAITLEKKTQTDTIEVYAWYAILLARTGRTLEAKRYLKHAKEIADRTERPLQRGVYCLTEGTVLVAEGDLSGALACFEHAVRIGKESDVFETLVRGKLELARTHLMAYLSGGGDKHLSSAAYHLNDLIQIAQEQGLQALHAEVLLLRSDIFRLDDKVPEAEGDLNRALSIASFLQDDRLKTEATERLHALTVTPTGSSTFEHQVATRSMDRVSAFRPARGPIVVPQPELYTLIAVDRDSGLPEFVYSFNEEMTVDSSIVSGFISAISSFSSTLMAGTGMLRSVNHEGFVLILEHTRSRIVVLVASKETFETRYRLRDFAAKFEERYPERVGSGGVDTKKYADAAELVASVFGADNKD